MRRLKFEVVSYYEADFESEVRRIQDPFKDAIPCWMSVDYYWRTWGPPLDNTNAEIEMRLTPAGYSTIVGFFGGTFERGRA